MWVSRIASGRSPPSFSSSVCREDSGPGSTSIPSTSQQPITCGRPRCSTSVTRIDGSLCSGGAGGQFAFRRERRAEPLLEAARLVTELLRRLVVRRPEGDPVGGGDQ